MQVEWFFWIRFSGPIIFFISIYVNLLQICNIFEICKIEDALGVFILQETYNKTVEKECTRLRKKYVHTLKLGIKQLGMATKAFSCYQPREF